MEVTNQEVTNDKSEATKAKINDMRAKLESLRKRKLEEEAAEVIIDEDQSPAKKCLQEVEEVAQTQVAPNEPSRNSVSSIEASSVKESTFEVIDLDDSADAADSSKPIPIEPVLTLKFHDQKLAK